jgi:predicted DCC family thiol-disulfide oxidoreductase YuxK
MNDHVVFYDGQCPLCHRAVLFFLKIDHDRVLRYAPLQSDFAKQQMGENYEKFMEKDTVIFLSGDEFFVESQAVIEALKKVAGYRWLGNFLGLFPIGLRNFVYRIVARFRPKSADTCPMMPPKYRDLFLS